MNGIRAVESLYCDYTNPPALTHVTEAEVDASAELMIEAIFPLVYRKHTFNSSHLVEL